MKQRFRRYSHDLAWQAADALLRDKWTRRDVLQFVEKYSSVNRKEIYEGLLNTDLNNKNEATEVIATLADEMIEQILSGKELDYIDPVTIELRPDGMTGKIREIANLSLAHQLLGHVAKLMLDPLFHARIYPWQNASIPDHGQTRLKLQIQKMLQSQKLDIKCYVKTDIVHAYGSLMYRDAIRFVRKEIRKYDLIIILLEYLETLAPDGHLIIGGYLDAWLFNYMMSYAIRHVFTQGRWRRGKFYPHVLRIATYMDDFVLLGRCKSGLERGLKVLGKWLAENLNMKLKQSSSIITLCSVEEEHRRKALPKASQRNCPGVDMGGFVIHRTYVTMRPRIFRRVRRAFERAYEEILRTGTLQIQRSRTIIARYSSVCQTTSTWFQIKYHVIDVLKVAKAVTRYHERARARRRRTWLKAVVERKDMLSVRMSADRAKEGGTENVCNHQNKIQAA